MLSTEAQAFFIDAFREVQSEMYATAVSKGWWDPSADVAMLTEHFSMELSSPEIAEAWERVTERDPGTMVALMHSELSEALEGMRHNNPPDEHCPDYSSVEIELADVIIRIMDYAERHNLDIAGALVAKANFNATREHKHGGKKF